MGIFGDIRILMIIIVHFSLASCIILHLPEQFETSTKSTTSNNNRGTVGFPHLNKQIRNGINKAERNSMENEETESVTKIRVQKSQADVLSALVVILSVTLTLGFICWMITYFYHNFHQPTTTAEVEYRVEYSKRAPTGGGVVLMPGHLICQERPRTIVRSPSTSTSTSVSMPNIPTKTVQATFVSQDRPETPPPTYREVSRNILKDPPPPFK